MSSGDFNNLVLRNTTSYNPDGSFISTGYVFTTTAKGKQNWTNNLNLNNLTASTLTLNSTLIIASSIVNDLQVNSTLNASTIYTQSLEFSTLSGSTINTTTLNTTQLVASGEINTSTLSGSTIYGTSIFGTNIGVSSLTGSTIQTDTLNVNSTLTASTITANLLNYSSLVGSTLSVSTLYASTFFSRLGNYSTLVGSTITTDSIQFSTMVGSTITLDTIIVNSSVYTSTFATGSLNFSTLFGSTIVANTVVVNSTINASTALNSTIVINTQSATPATHGYKVYVDQGVGSNETGIYVSNSNYPSNQGVSLGMINAGGSNYNSYAKIQGKTSGSAGTTNLIFQPDGGQIGIGTTNPQALVDIFLNSTLAAGSMFIYNNYLGLNSSGNDLTVSVINMGSVGGGNYYDSIRVRIPNGSSSDSARLDFCTPAGANNNTQLTRVSVMPSTGFVGIGTTNPVTLLHVLGSTLTQTLNVQSTLIASTITSRLLNYSSLVGSTITANTITSNSSIFGSTITTTGNVGIGTNNPSELLHVNGTAVNGDVSRQAMTYYTRPATLGVQNSVSAALFLGPNISTIAPLGSLDFRCNGGPTVSNNFGLVPDVTVMSLIGNGHVGIGTNVPGRKLTVQTANGTFGLSHTDGTIEVASFVGGSITGGWYGTVSNHPLAFYTNNSSAQMIVTTTGNVGIGATNPMYKTQIVLASNSSPSNLNCFSLTTADSTTESQRLYMGLVDNGGTGSTSYSWISASRYGYAYNTVSLQPEGGNVGIGITNPTYKLDVIGGFARIGTNITNNTIITDYTVQITNPTASFISYNGGYPPNVNPIVRNSIAAYYGTRDGVVSRGAAIDFEDISLNTTFPTEIRSGQIKFYTSDTLSQGQDAPLRMVLDPYGRLGINTASPLSSLYNYGSGTTGWKGLSYFGNETTGIIVGTYDNVAILGGHNAALNAWTNICIAAGGNVGIGNTNPVFKLDVIGSITCTSLVIGAPGTSVYEAGSIYSDSNWGMLFRAKQASPAGGQYVWQDSTGTVNYMIIGPSGNVGIGVTNPAMRLEVYGPTGFDSTNHVNFQCQASQFGRNQLYMTGRYEGANDAWAFSDPRNGIIFRTQSSLNSAYTQRWTIQNFADNLGFLSAGQNDNPVMVMANGGNVGIGTTIPSSKLVVYTSGGNNIIATDADAAFQATVSFRKGGTQKASIYVPQSSNDCAFYNDTYGANVFTLLSNGDVQLNKYTTNGTIGTDGSGVIVAGSSDRRIKENIEYQTDKIAALNAINSLKPATFNFIGSKDKRLGFIAQDLEQYIPLAVDGKKYEYVWKSNEDGTPKFDMNGNIIYKLDADGNRIIRPRGITDISLIAIQTLAIQQLITDKETLTQTVVNQSNTISTLQSNLSSLMNWVGYS